VGTAVGSSVAVAVAGGAVAVALAAGGEVGDDVAVEEAVAAGGTVKVVVGLAVGISVAVSTAVGDAMTGTISMLVPQPASHKDPQRNIRTDRWRATRQFKIIKAPLFSKARQSRWWQLLPRCAGIGNGRGALFSTERDSLIQRPGNIDSR